MRDLRILSAVKGYSSVVAGESEAKSDKFESCVESGTCSRARGTANAGAGGAVTHV